MSALDPTADMRGWACPRRLRATSSQDPDPYSREMMAMRPGEVANRDDRDRNAEHDRQPPSCAV
jgi:hypothetical protein